MGRATGAEPSNGRSDIVPRGSIPATRCTAHRTDGVPCRKWAIVGGTVCQTHGGSAPQVRRAAQARIQTRVLAAVDIAWKMIQDEDVPAATRARLLIDLQDRAGLKPADVSIVVPGETAPDLADAMRRALAARGLLPDGQDDDEDVLDLDAEDEDPEDEDPEA